MTPRLDLRDLDSRVVPAAARSLRRLLDGAERGRTRVLRRVRRVTAATSAAARRADARATSAGPLALLRDVPQLGLLVVAAVFLSGTAAAVLLAESEPTPSASPATSTFTEVVRLGVPPGSDVQLYLDQSRVVLDDIAARLPEARLLAVVHLSEYTPASQVLPLLEGADLQRVYLRASDAGADAEILALPVDAATAAEVLPALCTATAGRKAQDAENFAALATTIEGTTPDEQASKADFEAESARAAAESRAYAGECRTAFSAVVEAPAGVLQQIATRPGVRGVEPAPAGIALERLDVQPLLPETTGVVPPSGNER